MNSRPASFIGENHPSFGCGQAWFMFAMRVRGSITKVLLVNAHNPWAVQCVERILGEDQKASNTCECLSVFRDCSIGIRNDSIEEISFMEFMTVIVDKDRYLNDTLTIHAFEEAIKPAPESQQRQVPVPRRLPPVPPSQSQKKMPEKAKSGQGSPRYTQVLGVLTGLGYKSDQVVPVLKSLDVDFDNGDLNKIVHLALQNIAS